MLLVLIAMLYVASVPWYRDLDAPLQIVFGLPDWVAVAVACYVTAACLNAVAWLLSEVPAEVEPLTTSGGSSHSGESPNTRDPSLRPSPR